LKFKIELIIKIFYSQILNKKQWIARLKRIEKIVYYKFQTAEFNKEMFEAYTNDRNECLKEIAQEMEIIKFIMQRYKLLTMKQDKPDFHKRALTQMLSLLDTATE
jgi:hypothetical protein